MNRIVSLALVVSAIFLATSARAEDANWKHWRGPNENGSVESGAPPIEWNLEKNIKWKVEIPGKGSSTPIVHGNQVIVLTAVKTERVKEGAVAPVEPPPQEERSGRRRRFRRPAPTNYYEFRIISYDRADGTKLWDKVLTEKVPHEAGHQTNTFASSSPVTDGNNIYVDFGSRGIFCLDMKGDVRWQKDLGQMQTVATFGEGSSAAIADKKLIVPWDHQGDSFIVALDIETGEEVWRTGRDENTTWATPLIVEHKGRTQVITNGTKVRSYDLANGELVWECGGQVNNPIPSPILLGDHVICMTGYRGNAIQCISLDAEGDVTDSEMIAWSKNDAAPYVPSATLYKGHLYLNKGNDNIISCLDAESGEAVISKKRLDGLGSLYSSPVSAADHIYFTDRDGTTVVVKHGKDLEVVAKNTLGETIDASLAIVGDTIFARGEIHLFCISKN